jgi:hypothetical protein
MSVFLVKTKRDSILVQGDIEAWLMDRGAKPRAKGGFRIGREVVSVESIGEDALGSLARIFPGRAAEQALSADRDGRGR